MDFYSVLLDKKLGESGDLPSDFNLYVTRNLTKVTAKMLDGITSIRGYVFYSCSSLTSVEIPNSVTSIGNYAFWSCSSLTSVTVERTVPPTLGTNVFNNTHSSLKIYVPSASVNAYKAATNWSSYASKIQAIPN